MRYDYDLVVIGDGIAGIYAAMRARFFKARVALVRLNYLENSELWSSLFNQINNYFNHDWQDPFANKVFSSSMLANEAFASLAEQYSAIALSARGIDVIEGEGEFLAGSRVNFQVQQRELRSRAYLLSPTLIDLEPSIPGLKESGYLTPLDLSSIKNIENLPLNLTIVGYNSSALELAQKLAKKGKCITLIIDKYNWAEYIEPQSWSYILAIMQESGIEKIIEEPIIQIEKKRNKKFINLGKNIIEAEEIILVSPKAPKLNNLNLEAVGVDSEQLKINMRFQTNNPAIYSFDRFNELIPDLSQVEIIIKNSLFFPIFCRSKSIPPNKIIQIKPSFVQIGYSYQQAKETFNQPILFGTKAYSNSLKGQAQEQNSGFVKLIAKKNLQLIGATIIGKDAEEIAAFLLLAIKQKIKLHQLLKISYPFLSYSQLIYQATLDALDKADRKRLNYWLLSWFIWRKS